MPLRSAANQRAEEIFVYGVSIKKSNTASFRQRRGKGKNLMQLRLKYWKDLRVQSPMTDNAEGGNKEKVRDVPPVLLYLV